MLGQIETIIQSERGVAYQGRSGACLRQAGCAPTRMLLAGPDAGGEGADGGEVEFFVEPDGGAVLRGHGEGEFAEFHGAQGFGGGLHQHAAEAVSLIAWEDADLCSVADAGGNFAGEDGGNEFVAARLAKNE